MRLLGFLGASRLAAARDTLPAQVEAWREQWCFADDAWSIECQAEQALDPAPLHWLRATSPHGALHIAGRHADSWRRAVFGTHAGQLPEDASATHLLEQARLALVNILLQALGQAPVQDLSAAAPEAPGAALGPRALLRIELGDNALYCLLDAALFDAALPPLAAPPALVERKQAIGGARVRLTLQLPLTELALGDIDDLSPGDVLRAQARLDQPLTLASEPGDVLAKGYLARQQDRLALQLTK
ncbi:FliM/FliN family flagellar motor C-terminal domain-containing protein [Pseudomonas japonica]|uniref:Type III flagellar switch regulator (C-ring) FliN C-term n=1 Tax=Pseudomonas japonica TaxID=256466 RepID=A0A239BL77_9PSED|nr:FliM/FliN family flagellar motor C-terminal domain-containing protein [Pseudomonas japonica]SNS08118.1 Type III flagellar switch regulator (C-ring) FliN C-term [Pseudomonas japonica]